MGRYAGKCGWVWGERGSHEGFETEARWGMRRAVKLRPAPVSVPAPEPRHRCAHDGAKRERAPPLLFKKTRQFASEFLDGAVL